MKALFTAIIFGTLVLSGSSEAQAQVRLPQFSMPHSDSSYLQKQFSSSVKQLMMNDSLTWSGITSRLNVDNSRPKPEMIQKTSNYNSTPGKIPANPKDYINDLNINGNIRYMPKSSMGLMVY